MKLPYESVLPFDDATNALARELVSLIVKAGVTYRKANEALEAAQRFIETDTKPTFNV